ncbi:MAG: GTPase ObgE [Elusimicrobiales bacterium]|nr:GTPase ObgE [Elusimicrobiales bacterium]
MTQTKSGRSSTFIDTAHVYLKAGNGGNGASSFRREKYIPYGGPDGGHGGVGGSIWFVATSNVTTLREIAFHPHITAEDAAPGGGNRRDGANGEDKTLYVPLGTVIKKDGVILADLKEEGQRFRAAKGGRGGRGNTAFKTRFNTAPKISENGEPGEEYEAWLELSVLADVGLVGFPNAGKSTLLSVISAARPKIAGYPFTTLNPNIGMVSHKGKSFAAADIPGLIEGAHDGKGLGDVFLKHILRTKLLVHLVDPAGFGDMKPEKAVKVIEKELKDYHPLLGKKTALLAVNKSDLPEAEKVHELLQKKFKKREVFLISAATGKGVSKLLDRIIKLLPEIKQADLYKPESAAAGPLAGKTGGFRIEPDVEGTYVVKGARIEKLIAMTNFAQPDSWDRLRRIFRTIGLDKALKKAGAEEGNMVRILNREFQWSDAQAPTGKPGKFAYKYRKYNQDYGD